MTWRGLPWIGAATIADVIDRIHPEGPSVVVSLVPPTQSEDLLAKLCGLNIAQGRVGEGEDDE